VQQDFTAENVVTKLREILPDGPARAKMVGGLAAVRTELRGPSPDKMHPVDRAARAVMALLGTKLGPSAPTRASESA